MKQLRNAATRVALSILVMTLAMAGCQNKNGSLEKIRHDTDKAFKKTGKAIKGAVKDVKEKINDD